MGKIEGTWMDGEQKSAILVSMLIFIMPLLVIYEASVLLLGRDAVRSGLTGRAAHSHLHSDPTQTVPRNELA